MNRILLPKLDLFFADRELLSFDSSSEQRCEEKEGERMSCEKWRIPWEVDRFQCKFFSHLFVCILLNSSYCRSDVFRKYEADVPM